MIKILTNLDPGTKGTQRGSDCFSCSTVVFFEMRFKLPHETSCEGLGACWMFFEIFLNDGLHIIERTHEIIRVIHWAGMLGGCLITHLNEWEKRKCAATQIGQLTHQNEAPCTARNKPQGTSGGNSYGAISLTRTTQLKLIEPNA